MSFQNEYTIADYLECKTDLADRVVAIEALIDAMLVQMVTNVSDSGTAEFQLDDGQIKIRTVFRNINEVTRGIESLERIKNIYNNRLRGRIGILRDEKVFRR